MYGYVEFHRAIRENKVQGGFDFPIVLLGRKL